MKKYYIVSVLLLFVTIVSVYFYSAYADKQIERKIQDIEFFHFIFSSPENEFGAISESQRRGSAVILEKFSKCRLTHCF